MLHNDHIRLRALEPTDLDHLYGLENDTDLWTVSYTLAPFSKALLADYITNAHQDIYEAKQLRLVICSPKEDFIGCIDLFDFDPYHHRAGVGVVINNHFNRQQGYASMALELVKEYAINHLQLHQLYCTIEEDNTASIQLFEKAGFSLSGVRKAWNFHPKGYKNELFYQYINEKI